MTKKHVNIPIFIPEMACPNRCVFCNQHKITSNQQIPEPEEVPSIIESYLATIQLDTEVNVAFFGGNFTGIPLKDQEAYLKYVQPFIQSGRVHGIRISTRPDYISCEVLDLLKKYNLSTIELGAQSTDKDVLISSGRGHSKADIENASKLILEYGIELGLQMMIGLPGDSLEKSIKTAKDIVSLGATNTRIYPTLVIKDTVLETLYLEKKYAPLSLDESVAWIKQILPIFEEHLVTILRIGIHPSEELDSSASLLAGPYHPSTKELVMTEIWKDLLTKKLEAVEHKALQITVNSKQLNYAVGYYGSNKKHFEKLGYSLKFEGSNSMDKYHIDVSNN